MTARKGGGERQGENRLDEARLDALVEEVIVDAYDETEQAVGLFTMIEDYLKLLFVTRVLGVEVTVTGIEMTDGDAILALCERKGEEQEIPITTLPLPEPPPEGWEWIAAYRHWARIR